jgi:hypothetical protein
MNLWRRGLLGTAPTTNPNAVRLRVRTLAYNLANFPRAPAPSEQVRQLSLTILTRRLVKIGPKNVRQNRFITFLMRKCSCRVTCSGRFGDAIATWSFAASTMLKTASGSTASAQWTQAGGNLRQRTTIAFFRKPALIWDCPMIGDRANPFPSPDGR